jgi:uncharacterized damage-inducible protein DinB
VTEDTRTEPPTTGDERAILLGLLEHQRQTLAWKCSGLTADQLREQAVPPSGISLLGLLRHLAKVERSWFGRVLAGEPDWRPVWETDTAGGFDVTDADAAAAVTVWQEACASSREFVNAAESLGITGTYDGQAFSLRYVLGHLIEEYARHNGHADFIRERLDGSTGE